MGPARRGSAPTTSVCASPSSQSTATRVQQRPSAELRLNSCPMHLDILKDINSLLICNMHRTLATRRTGIVISISLFAYSQFQSSSYLERYSVVDDTGCMKRACDVALGAFDKQAVAETRYCDEHRSMRCGDPTLGVQCFVNGICMVGRHVTWSSVAYTTAATT